MSSTTLPNSNPSRKQLSDQLDRLDTILDVLADGLNGAVADAAREGTRLAVKDAIVEILTDLTLPARLHEATAPEPAAKRPGLWARLKEQAGQVVQAVSRVTSNVIDRSVQTTQALAGASRAALHTLAGLRRLKNLALLGLGVGIAVGVASYLAPHVVSAALSGLGAAATATAVHLGVWTRRTFRALTAI